MAKKEFKVPAAKSFISAPVVDPDQEDAKAKVPTKTAKEKKTEEALERLNAYPVPEGYEVPVGFMLVPERRAARINLMIEPSLKNRLKKAAAIRGVSMNELIVRLIDENV